MIATQPSAKEVRDLLNDLLGRDVEIQASDAWAPLPSDVPAAAEFVDDHLQLQVVVVLDLALATYIGACIGLIPAGGAQDMVAEKSPSEMVMSNCYEVLNILTSVFNKPDNPHVRITNFHRPGAALPADVAQIAGRPAGRLDLAVDISGYGKGRLGLVAA
ncbi:hypothetical protein [uncultured Jatrophihabitans sp.]|uniref:hypothetical protein n=1 Tax=uncultured Jatrophihabitans sp. TaxID=1610747 RepID=UPI0035CB63E0